MITEEGGDAADTVALISTESFNRWRLMLRQTVNTPNSSA